MRPGLWNDAQVEGWKPVVEAVHQAGGRIVAQLWHMGRLVHPSVGGSQPVSASATTAPAHAHTYEGKQPYVEARAADPGRDQARSLPIMLPQRATRSRRLRRRPDPRRQRLSGRPVPARRHQPARRRLWRADRQPPSLHARGGRGGFAAKSASAGPGIRLSPNGEVQGCQRQRQSCTVHRRRRRASAARRAMARAARARPALDLPPDRRPAGQPLDPQRLSRQAGAQQRL